jgi:hypothetical protein
MRARYASTLQYYWDRYVVLRAADPKALERFYLDALGLRLERREGKLVQLRAGDALIDIVPADEAGTRSWRPCSANRVSPLLPLFPRRPDNACRSVGQPSSLLIDPSAKRT